MDNHAHSVQRHGTVGHSYSMFAVNMVLSFVIMYLVMFSMIDGWSDFRNNVNTFYMALLWWRPWESSCWRPWARCIEARVST